MVPPASSGALKFDVENVELSIGTPSITNNGWFEPKIELMPRMLMNELAPGSPDCCSTVTLGAFPANASTTLVSVARSIKYDTTLLRTFPSFSEVFVVQAPVTPTSTRYDVLAPRTQFRYTQPKFIA